MNATKQLRIDSDMKDEIFPGIDRTHNRISSITGQAEYCYRMFVPDRKQFSVVSLDLLKRIHKIIKGEPYKEVHISYMDSGSYHYMEAIVSYSSSRNEQIVNSINMAVMKACSKTGLTYAEPLRRRPEYYADNEIRGLIRTDYSPSIEAPAASETAG